MSEPRPIGVATDYDGLIDIFCARAEELNITRETIDRLCGWPTGFAGKVLSRVRNKKIGPTHLLELLQVLALKMPVVEDVEAAARMAPRWEQRVRPDYNASRLAKVGEKTIKRMFPIIAHEIAVKGGKARFAAMTPAQKRKHQQRAGRARWRKRKAKPSACRAADTSPKALRRRRAPQIRQPQCAGTAAATTPAPAL